MSAQNHLDELLKIAVVGLQNSTDFRQVLSEPVRATLATKNYDNEAQGFLDAAALSFQQAELSRIPTEDNFEELPEIPPENLQALNPEQSLLVERLFNNEYRQPGIAALHLLQRYNYALPELLFCELLETRNLEKNTAIVLRAVASARSRWLCEMNRSWRSVLDIGSEPTPFHQARSNEQRWRLEDMNAEDIATFCLAQWNQCTANGRGVLLSYLRSYPLAEAEMANWLVENLQDKSAPVKQQLMRWFSACDHPQAETLRQAVQEQLSLHLDSSKPRKPDLNPPEKLHQSLVDLSVLEQDKLGSDLAKPVQYLAQLLILSGPKLWAEQLGCDTATAMERLLKTRFSEELERALLAAALYHQDEAALNIWCKKVQLKERSLLPDCFSEILSTLGPRQSLHWVELLLQHKKISMLISVTLWRQLVEFRCVLPREKALQFFEQWCQYIVKHRYAFDRDSACTLPLCLDLNLQDLQQSKYWRAVREKQKFPSANLDLFESLIQLKTELHNHCHNHCHNHSHHEVTP